MSKLLTDHVFTSESVSEGHPDKVCDQMSDAILDASSRRDIILDPFLGSGSTLMACQRVGRICHGIELDPLYVDVIIRRWQRDTGARHRANADEHRRAGPRRGLGDPGA